MKLRIQELKSAKAAREERKISYRVMESETGISKSTLHALDRGKIEEVRKTYLDALGSYFGVKACDLITLDDVHLPLTEPFRTN